MTATLTIGLPVHNGERYLAEALESVRSQTLRDIEIVVSDNGSTDATEEICRAAAREDERIRYLRSPENRGGAWNFMNVARRASAPLFTWMAADDVKAPRFAQACADALAGAGPRAVLACPHTRLVDADGAVFEDLNDAAMGLGAATAHERLRGLVRSQASHVTYGVIRTDALRRTRGILAMVGDDMVLLTELLCLGPAVYVDEPLFLQRRHPEQFSALGADQVGWHAPGRGVRFAFPQIRLDLELHRAIARSPLGRAERARCAREVLTGWILPRRRAIARDLATALGVSPRWRPCR